MSELNKVSTIEVVEDSIREEIEADGASFITQAEVEFAMEGYNVGVESAEGVIERLCGENGWTYKERKDGFAISDAQWKLNNMEQYAEKDVNQDFYGEAHVPEDQIHDEKT